MLDRYDAIDAAEAVISDTDVCDGCMRPIKDADEQDLERLGVGPNGQNKLQTTVRVGGGVAGTAVAQEMAHGAIRTHETRTYCNSCGSMDGRGADATLSVQDAVLRAAELGVRLREDGTPINPRTMAGIAKHLKRKPEYAGKDDDVAKAAAGMALERARVRDVVRAHFGRDP